MIAPAYRRRLRRAATFVLAFAAGLWVCDRWMASRVTAGELLTSTQPATEPTSRPVLSADVQAVAQRLVATYAHRPMRFTATLDTHFDVAGIVENNTRQITAAVESATKFRHEAKDELLIVADDKSVHLYAPADNVFVTKKLDDRLDDEVHNALSQQDPALLIAITGDAEHVLAPTGDAHVELQHSANGDELVATLSDGMIIHYAIENDAIASVQFDFAGMLKAKGATDVKRAEATLVYSKTERDVGPIAAETFAFAAPAGARKAVAPTEDDVGGGGDPAATLTGKPAPSIALKDLDGNDVKAVGSGAEKGVVVLDFWATWCPPCRAGLPHVNAVAKRFAERGVRVYAVNQREPSATVKSFIAEQKLADLHVLLDADGAIGKAYAVSGIPQTVVIGRDGVVKKVIVGFDPAHADELDAAVENASK